MEEFLKEMKESNEESKEEQKNGFEMSQKTLLESTRKNQEQTPADEGQNNVRQSRRVGGNSTDMRKSSAPGSSRGIVNNSPGTGRALVTNAITGAKPAR